MNGLYDWLYNRRKVQFSYGRANPLSKRPITIEDLYQIKTIEDPRLSPDGQWIAYVLVTPDKMDNGYKRNIWLVPTGGGEPVQLTRSGKDSQPRWSPDGKLLAFTSARDKKPQIYLLPVAAPGGEPRALTSMSNGATTPVWSPDGTRIAFLAQMNADERAKEDSGEEDRFQEGRQEDGQESQQEGREEGCSQGRRPQAPRQRRTEARSCRKVPRRSSRRDAL